MSNQARLVANNMTAVRRAETGTIRTGVDVPLAHCTGDESKSGQAVS